MKIENLHSTAIPLSMLSTFFDIIQIVCMEVAIQCTTAIESPFHGRMSIMKALLDHKASSGLLLRCDDSETTPSPPFTSWQSQNFYEVPFVFLLP